MTNGPIRPSKATTGIRRKDVTGRASLATPQLMGGTILVTGVSGFIGSAVVRALVAAGSRVRGVARKAARLADFPGELVNGDLRDPVTAMRTVAGVTHVYHVAADYRVWARDPSEIVRNNRLMTANVMAAVLAAGVERIVYTSSVATLRPDPRGPSDETRPAESVEATGAYKRSKVACERLVEALVAERGLPAVIVNPSTPMGPGDARPTPTGRIVIEAANGRMPGFVDTGLNLVHVDDVARGHLLAMAHGRLGERYVLGGDDVTLADFLAEIAVRTGRKPPRLRLPRAPLVPLAWLNERRARIIGREPFLTMDGLRMARDAMYFSSAKAERELGYAHRPWREAVTDAVTWFRETGAARR